MGYACLKSGIKTENIPSRWEFLGTHSCKHLQTLLFVDYFLKTHTPGKLWVNLPEEMTEQYQCMTFWYKFSFCSGMSFQSTQELVGWNTIQMTYSLTDKQENNRWLYGEMPLERRRAISKVSIRHLKPSWERLFIQCILCFYRLVSKYLFKIKLLLNAILDLTK